jgi:hypothetical protein
MSAVGNPMSSTSVRAKRYLDRAEECLQIIATAETPGSGEIYLLIAHHCLLLAASEKRRVSSQPSIRRPRQRLSTQD